MATRMGKSAFDAMSLVAGATAILVVGEVARRRGLLDEPAHSGQRRAGQSQARRRSGAVARPASKAEGAGAGARSPREMPAAGWKAVLWRVWQQIGEHRILLVAAGVTFYALLALFPAVAALVSIFGLVADPQIIGQQVQALKGVLPSGAIDIIGGEVQRIAAQGGGSLSVGFAAGLAVSLWSANAGMKSLFDALNIVYDETERRSFIVLNAQSLALTVGAIIMLIIAMAAIVVLPAVFSVVGFGGSTFAMLLSLARWPVLLLVVAFALAVLYRFGPSRERPRWQWVTWGSALAAMAWLVGSLLFSWYVANFASYNKTYGSLGAAIGFLTWVWLTAIVILAGAELNAELEHQTAEDTTSGQPRPVGQRGATKADTVAAA